MWYMYVLVSRIQELTQADQLHYLNDFLFWSAAGAPECAESLDRAIRMHDTLVSPLHQRRLVVLPQPSHSWALK